MPTRTYSPIAPNGALDGDEWTNQTTGQTLMWGGGTWNQQETVENAPVTITGSSSPQLTVGYDASNTITVAVSSAGATTFDGTGASAGFTFNKPITVSATAAVVSTSATAFTVARSGTNYGLQVDESTASAVTGLKITPNIAGSGLALSVINGNAAENLTIDAKGSGTISLNAAGTGGITLGRATTITTGNLTATSGDVIITSQTKRLLIGTDISQGNQGIYVGVTSTSNINIGQGTSNNVSLQWVYNATPASASANLVTTGYSNPIAIDASSVTIQTNGTGGITLGKATTITTGGLTVTAGGATITAGNLGIGGVGQTNEAIKATGAILSGGQTSHFGVAVDVTYPSTATTAGSAYWGQLVTAAASFTMVNGAVFQAAAPSLGASSAVTTLSGLTVANQGASGVTNAYGVYIAAQSGAATTNIGLYNAGTTTLVGNLTISAANIVTDTSTGTKIGTATNQLLGFYNATPVAQRSGAAQAAVVTTASTQTTPFGYATQGQADGIVTLVNELRAWAVAQGFIKGSS